MADAVSTQIPPRPAATRGSPTNAATAPHLHIESPDGASSEVMLHDVPLVIGRGAEADLPLGSPHVSRRHAELRRDPFGRWWIRDLGSRNGFRVNGHKLKEHALVHGDVITIHDFQLRFLEPAAAPKAAPDTHSTVIVSDSPSLEITALAAHTPAKIDATHLSTLTQFGHSLMQHGDPRKRLELLCSLLIRDDFHGRAATVLRLDRAPGNQEQPPQAICPAAMRDDGDLPYVSRRLMTALRKNAAPVLASSTPAREAGALELSVNLDAAPMAAMACPLRCDQEAIDLLYVTFPADYGTMEWMALVVLAAQQFQQAEAALTLQQQSAERALLERELARARDIQMRLVPRQIDIAGMEVEIGFEPCKWVGGDMADVIPLPGGRAALIIADVCGKGLSAALVGSGMHTMIHGLLSSGVDLAATINSLNRHLCQYLPDNSFVTLLGVVVDPATGDLTCINAGHPGGIVISATGETRTLPEAQNLPLGISDADLCADVDRLDPGEMLALFTDGLTELRDESGRMVGQDDLAAILAELYRGGGGVDQSLTDHAAALNARLDQIQGGSMPLDDRTFLLARRR